MRSGTPWWPGGGGPGRPLVLAHRGGRPPVAVARDEAAPGQAAVPWENTVVALVAAGHSGADGVEVDVRATADGVPVVLHDADVPDLGPVHALERTALPAWIPTLDAALEACGDLLVDVEVKAPPAGAGFDVAGLADAVVRAVAPRPGRGSADHGGHRWGPASGPSAPAGRRLLTSFWPAALRAAAATAAELELDLPLGLLCHPAASAAEAVATAVDLGCAVLLPPWPHVTPALVDRARAHGLAVVTWTVNDAGAFRAVADAGVDGVVTDEVAETLAHRRDRSRPS